MNLYRLKTDATYRNKVRRANNLQSFVVTNVIFGCFVYGFWDGEMLHYLWPLTLCLALFGAATCAITMSSPIQMVKDVISMYCDGARVLFDVIRKTH